MGSLKSFKFLIIVLSVFSICYSSENKNDHQMINSVPGGPDVILTCSESTSERITIYVVHVSYNGEAYGKLDGTVNTSYYLEDLNKSNKLGDEIAPIQLKKFVKDDCGHWVDNPYFIGNFRLIEKVFNYIDWNKD